METNIQEAVYRHLVDLDRDAHVTAHCTVCEEALFADDTGSGPAPCLNTTVSLTESVVRHYELTGHRDVDVEITPRVLGDVTVTINVGDVDASE